MARLGKRRAEPVGCPVSARTAGHQPHWASTEENSYLCPAHSSPGYLLTAHPAAPLGQVNLDASLLRNAPCITRELIPKGKRAEQTGHSDWRWGLHVQAREPPSSRLPLQTEAPTHHPVPKNTHRNARGYLSLSLPGGRGC